MLSVQEAVEKILAFVFPLPVEEVALGESLGRAVGEAVYACSDLPPFESSAMDGYAVDAEEIANASPDQPAPLQEWIFLPAGGAAVPALPKGHAARVMTGAPIPPGATAVVMLEQTRREGKTVWILQPARKGENIRRQGEDVRAGELLLEPGETITAGALAMLAAQGVHHPVVHRLPKVAILTTGDELVPIEQQPGFGQIRNSNQYLLRALVAQAPAEVVKVVHAPDEPAAIRDVLKEMAACSDLILSCGGVSVGDRDYVRSVVEQLGTLEFWRVKVKPGKPFVFGRIRETLFFGLPGNPVSAFVTFELFVRPALRQMGGFRELFRRRIPVVAAHDFPPPKGREEYVRVRLHHEAVPLYASSAGAQGSHILSSLLRVDALLVVPADLGVKAGETAEAILL